MNFTAIDFETANSHRSSACALGITVVRKGIVVEKNSWLIRPKTNKFDYMNIDIHGIRPEDVENEPEFDELYENVFKDYLVGELIVAHNASFDMSVLRYVLDQYNIEYPKFDYICTVKLCQKQWPDLDNHKLNTISNYLNFKFKHHDALDDTLACANALVKIGEENNLNCPVELAKALKIKVGKMYAGGYKACSSAK